MGTEPLRFNVGPDPEHPGFSEMQPNDNGHWVRWADIREELETAWLRGFIARVGGPATPGRTRQAEQEAADYAERVVGGATRPERPEVGR